MRLLVAEVRHRAVMFGYWLRPYDGSLDGRRWRWEAPYCGTHRLTAEDRAALQQLAAALDWDAVTRTSAASDQKTTDGNASSEQS